MMYNPTPHTLPTYHVTKITRFPSGLRLSKLRNTSNQGSQVEVECQTPLSVGQTNLSLDQIVGNAFNKGYYEAIKDIIA